MSDPIGDFIIRIKNAYMARHLEVSLPFSKMKQTLAEILTSEGYLDGVDLRGDAPKQELVIKLKYINSKPAMTDVKRISKPGRRLYSSAQTLPKTLGGYGSTIISTSQGILTDKQARQQNVGGELIFQIW